MLLLVALAEILGMTLWFSATAAAPQLAAEFALDAGWRAWLTMAVQAGFVAGTLITAVTNMADAISARRLFAAGCLAGAACNAAIVAAPSIAAILVLRFCTGAALAWVYPPGMKIAGPVAVVTTKPPRPNQRRRITGEALFMGILQSDKLMI